MISRNPRLELNVNAGIAVALAYILAQVLVDALGLSANPAGRMVIGGLLAAVIALGAYNLLNRLK